MEQDIINNLINNSSDYRFKSHQIIHELLHLITTREKYKLIWGQLGSHLGDNIYVNQHYLELINAK